MRDFAIAAIVFFALFVGALLLREIYALFYALLVIAGIGACFHITSVHASNAGDEMSASTDRGRLLMLPSMQDLRLMLRENYLFSGTRLGTLLVICTATLFCIFEYFLNNRAVNPNLISLQSLTKLAYYICLVALAEEIWFRGIFFWICRKNLLLSLLVPTIIFAGIHFPIGGAVGVLATLGMGTMYASLRLAGANLIALAIAHGSINWFYSAATINPGPSVFGGAHWAMIIAFACFISVALVLIAFADALKRFSAE